MSPAEDWESRAIADRWWHRDPASFRRKCDEVRAMGRTLLAYIRWRLDTLRFQRAAEYASTLEVGATVDEYDLEYCAPFVADLPMALAQRGLRLVGTNVESTEQQEATT